MYMKRYTMSVRNVWFFYSMPSTLKKHIKSTHYKCEKGFKCTACPFATSNLDSFHCHKQRVHGERNKTCVCEKCGYTPTPGAASIGIKNHTWVWKKERSKNAILVLVNSLTWGNWKLMLKWNMTKLCSLLRPLCAAIVTIHTRTTFM